MFKIDHVTDELSLARLRAAHERPYFATAIFRMVPVLTDKLPTLAVDKWWRMYYNNEWLKGHTPQENATALIHEVEHLLRNHAGRCEMHGCEHEQFNLAGDLEINDDLDADPRLKLPHGVLNPKTWRDDLAKGLDVECTQLDPDTFNLPTGLTAEEYYALLGKQFEKIRQRMNLPQCGSAAHGKRGEEELGDPNGENRGVGTQEGELVRERVAEETKEYAAKHPGSVPAGHQRWAQSVLNPKIPWQRVLSGMIRGNVARVAGMADYSYQRPGRRQACFDDFITASFVEPTPNVAIVIDTSGSMEEQQLSRALAETRGVLRSTGTDDGVSLLSCDCSASAAARVYSDKQIQLIGGGGTDMGVGIRAANKLRPTPDFIIVMTDGYTPWPASPPQGSRVIVVLVGTGTAPGWAQTVYVDD